MFPGDNPPVAERIKSEFRPLYDPAAEPISKPLASISQHIQEKAGYSLYDAQLAGAEALKRDLDKKGEGLLVADCGTGKTRIGVSALYAYRLGKEEKHRKGRKTKKRGFERSNRSNPHK